MYPDDLKYTTEHEWIRLADDTAEVGITDYAQEQLGDIVYVSLPDAGTEVEAGTSIGELESTKSVSDIFAPVSGTVAESNPALDDAPEVVNTDPYGAGWLVRITVADSSAMDGLLDADGYRAHVGE
ncbi:MAG TPA: glycine cleavage system protein GcvH [Nocardioidaceae bacterium]|nr:glycine cleavage system protein GcvH [Nocardioidaceae bacterium]